LEVQTRHVDHYAAETIKIRTWNEPVQQIKKDMHIMNILIGLTIIIPLLAILGTCGGNAMLTILIVLALIPLGYIFAKFF
jgi:hypothetical protein